MKIDKQNFAQDVLTSPRSPRRQLKRLTPRKQQGAVAIIVALTFALLIGFAGLSLDLGRMYVAKSELQAAADSCALAASQELTCDPAAGACGGSYLAKARDAALTTSNLNKKNFQSAPAGITVGDIKFSTTALGPYSTITAGADGGSRFVECIARQTGIVPWFMQVMGAGNQTVNAVARATLAPGQTANAAPIGYCAAAAGSPPDFGLQLGKWYSGKFGPPGGPPPPALPPGCTVIDSACTGSFNWIDFTPPTGGATELKALLAGTGQYNLPPVGTLVGQNGAIASLGEAWNTRFGLYKGSYNGPNHLSDYPPDHTGYAYTPTNWPSCSNALGGTPGGTSTAENYNTKRAVNAPYGNPDAANGNLYSGLSIGNPFNVTQTNDLRDKGKDRRLAIAPIVDCSAWCAGGTGTIPVLGYACVFLLHPIDGTQGVVRMEYRGRANEPGSPCATAGTVGGPGSVGPLVAALIQ